MKANEMPEKIYIFENPILDFTKLSVRQSDTDIEYVRKDAFIERACSILKDISCQIEIIEQFKKRIR